MLKYTLNQTLTLALALGLISFGSVSVVHAEEPALNQERLQQQIQQRSHESAQNPTANERQVEQQTQRQAETQAARQAENQAKGQGGGQCNVEQSQKRPVGRCRACISSRQGIGMELAEKSQPGTGERLHGESIIGRCV